MTELLPLFLRLEGRRVLVVGGGGVASRKVAELLAARARVHVVALAASEELAARAAAGEIALTLRAFEERDVEGAWLAVACTGDSGVQRGIAAVCDARQTFCVAVDDPPNASAFFGSVLRRPPLVVALSSSGEAPALTRLMREVLEHALPPARWVESARALRAQWKRDGTPMDRRFGELFRKLAADRGDDASVDDAPDDEQRGRR